MTENRQRVGYGIKSIGDLLQLMRLIGGFQNGNRLLEQQIIICVLCTYIMILKQIIVTKNVDVRRYGYYYERGMNRGIFFLFIVHMDLICKCHKCLNDNTNVQISEIYFKKYLFVNLCLKAIAHNISSFHKLNVIDCDCISMKSLVLFAILIGNSSFVINKDK